MDRWKAEMGRVREKRRVEERRWEKRKSQKKEDADARKWFVAPEGRKVDSLKRQVRSHLARWEMKKCTSLWREAHLEVKKIEKAKSTSRSDHFWKLRCRKSARRCGAKHISKSKCTKHTILGPLLEVQMSFRVAGARDCAPCQKWAKREVFVAFPQTMAGVGHLKRICKDAFSVAGALQETCSSELLGGPGADFLRGVAFWSIRSSGLLRWFCVTGAALRMTWHHFFVAGAVV